MVTVSRTVCRGERIVAPFPQNGGQDVPRGDIIFGIRILMTTQGQVEGIPCPFDSSATRTAAPVRA